MCDFEPEETQRQLSVSLAIAPFELDGVKVNLLDVPGYADFAAELAIALAVSRPRGGRGERDRRSPGPDARRRGGPRQRWGCPA